MNTTDSCLLVVQVCSIGALGCLTGDHLACRPYLCMAKVKRFQDSKFNISNITQAIHKMLQNLNLLCSEIMCEILSRLILYFWLVAKKYYIPKTQYC